MTGSKAQCQQLASAPGRFQLSGILDFDSVPVLLAGLSADDNPMLGKGDIYIDLVSVDRANSAGMGLLIEWLVQAHHQQRNIFFCNLPASLQQIARISDLDLPLEKC